MSAADAAEAAEPDSLSSALLDLFKDAVIGHMRGETRGNTTDRALRHRKLSCCRGIVQFYITVYRISDIECLQ